LKYLFAAITEHNRLKGNIIIRIEKEPEE